MMRPLLITRPEPQAKDFAEAASRSCPGKFEPVVSPLLEIRPEPCSVDLSGAQALLFTSQNGVRAFADRSSDRSLPALCVGAATAQLAASLGFSAMSADGDASALASLAAQSYLPDFGFMLHFRGGEAAGDIVGTLAAEGIPAEDRIIYDQYPLFLSAEAKAKIDGRHAVVVVFSPRSANLLADELDAIDTSRTIVAAISPAAAEPLANREFAKFYAAKVPNSQAVLEILKNI